MTDLTCTDCGVTHTSAAALMYCCTDTDRHGRPRRAHGDDWIP